MDDTRIIGYDEVVRIPGGENGEPLVDVRVYDHSIIAEHEKPDMRPYTGSVVYVRDTLAQKLARVNHACKEHGVQLRVVYGYRHPDIQRSYFETVRADITLRHPDLSQEEIDRLTHPFIAVPDVAGHPTGGAVDVCLADGVGNMLDFGTVIADFERADLIETFAPGITDLQRRNRMLLRQLMMHEGFVPFNGEWWHFSYGDREWACFTGAHSSLYSPIDFRPQETAK